MPRKEVLHKNLGAFKLGSLGSRAENSQSSCLENIDNSFNQRCFRADNGQINAVFLNEIRQCVKVGNRKVFSKFIGSTVTRREVDLLYIIVLFEYASDGVLSSPAAYDQYIHIVILPFSR